MTVNLAKAMGVTNQEMVHIRRGALLHDIGNMAVPESILFKQAELTVDEWVTIHMHPYIAYEMLEPITFLRPALDILYYHHEKWDGTGYPRRKEQPLAAKINSRRWMPTSNRLTTLLGEDKASTAFASNRVNTDPGRITWKQILSVANRHR
jgi:hypothetical protein